ncbi:hypothetical protein KFE25_006723 [Diacronema lutheri]|uniref:Calponin-homology (CH) domain-containing protein n=1 Tax=Diacronema lutheri TaxID=2081491 RepID=A0A8J5XRF3_DIALT|nr:hypothetical protein KFE25_006723 [Diacronema lutheri]
MVSAEADAELSMAGRIAKARLDKARAKDSTPAIEVEPLLDDGEHDAELESDKREAEARADEKDDEVLAATLIASAFRGRKVRVKITTQHSSATYIQKNERGRQTRKRLLVVPLAGPLDLADRLPSARDPTFDLRRDATAAPALDVGGKAKQLRAARPRLARRSGAEAHAAPSNVRPHSPAKAAASATAAGASPTKGRERRRTPSKESVRSHLSSTSSASAVPRAAAARAAPGAMAGKPPWLADTEKVGIMNPSLNRSKRDIIEWIQRDLAQPNFTEIKQLHTGAVFAQILDRMFPGTVRLERVAFNVSNEVEIVKNWNVVQAALVRNQVSRGFDVPKLMLPNAVILLLEAAQWLYLAVENQHKAGQLPAYNAAARLAECKVKPILGAGRK